MTTKWGYYGYYGDEEALWRYLTEVDIANFALGRIGSAKITALTDKDDVNLSLLYYQTRNKLLLAYPWNFARTRVYLEPKKYISSKISFNSASTASAWGYFAWGSGTWGYLGDVINDSGSLLITNGSFRDGDRVKVTGSVSNDGTYSILFTSESQLVLLSTEELTDEAAGALITLERKPGFEFDYYFELPINYLGNPKLYESTSVFTIEGRSLLCNDSEINLIYTKQVTNIQDCSPNFVECLILSLAAELAIPIANDRNLRNDILQELQVKLLNDLVTESSTDKYNEAFEDTSWQTAGR